MIGIVIGNTGSPSSPEPDAVETFLQEYLMDDHIRQMPRFFWQRLLNKHILPRRKFSSSERYRQVWTELGSPLVANQELLVKKIQTLFDNESPDEQVAVVSAMGHGSPSMEEALGALREKGADKLILLPLYPQSAFSVTLPIVDAFQRAQDALDWHPDPKVIESYHDDEGYLDALTRSIEDADFDAGAGDRLLFSFHAIPLKDEKAGDTYRKQIGAAVKAITQRLDVPDEQVAIGFQSVFGPHQKSWTGPLSKDILEQWQDGDFRVFFCCPGFVVDCLETLDDVPRVMIPALEGTDEVLNGASGRFVWVPTFNDSLEHAQLVKAILERYL